MNKGGFKENWQGEADCSRCAIRNSVLFAGLEQSECERLHRPIDDFILPPHSRLYRAGETAQYLYTIRKGLLKLVQYLPDGRQRIVRLLRDTDVTGLEALLGQPYQHDAIVLQQAEICRLPLEEVQRLDRENPKLHRELMTRWQRALDEADAWLTQLATGSARARMARLLLRLAHQDERPCELFGREDMGAMLGITTETASRIIAEFRRGGIIREAGGDTVECDIRALENIAAD
jgi:CRP-like cAMP-binding protein